MRVNTMMKRLIIVAMAAVMIISLTTCGTTTNDTTEERKDSSSIVEDNTPAETTTPEDTSTEESTSNKTEYPLTITTYNSDGTELVTTYEQAPERVIAVYQGSIETLLALGLEDKIVATAGLDNEVPDELKEAFSKTNYLDEFTPSLETVTMLEPDFIFSWGSFFGERTLGDASGWVEKGTNIYMNSNTRPRQDGAAYTRNLENEYTDILNLGKIFDVQDKAEALVAEMKATIETVVNETANMEDRPTVIVMESLSGGITNYGATSLGGDMVTALGGELANPDASSLGKEDLIVANPDVIFVVYMPYAGDDAEAVMQANLDVVLADESLASLDAVKNGRVVPIMLSEMYASATRTQDGIETFAMGLYEELTTGN